jgi:uncharacterized damage-inducible protein DinB
MGLADHARLLTAYNAWANQLVLEQVLTLDDDELDRDGGASKGSIRGNLSHILQSQTVWLSRWKGESPNLDIDVSRTGLPASFAAADTALREFAAGLTDADWDREIAYNDSSGNAHRVVLGALITHVVNHGTLHRGEAGMLLAALGRSPGDLDVVYYVLSR